MIKLLILLLLSFKVSAASELLTKRVTSGGLARPEHRFVKTCLVETSGHFETLIKRGDGTSQATKGMLTRPMVWQLRQLIRIASRSEIVKDGVRCDGGDHIVTGYRGSNPVIMKEILDCYRSSVRKGWAARRVQKLATSICNF